MLLIATRLSELRFNCLMDVYAESNAENAEEFYPNEENGIALNRVESEFYQYLKEVFFTVEGACYAVWEEDGEYRSALRLEPYRDGLLIEALETHPQYRKMGYGKTLIRSVQKALAQKRSPVLYSHIGKRNTASLRTHLACGFQRISEQAVYIDGSVTDRSCTMRYRDGSESLKDSPTA